MAKDNNQQFVASGSGEKVSRSEIDERFKSGSLSEGDFFIKEESGERIQFTPMGTLRNVTQETDVTPSAGGPQPGPPVSDGDEGGDSQEKSVQEKADEVAERTETPEQDAASTSADAVQDEADQEDLASDIASEQQAGQEYIDMLNQEEEELELQLQNEIAGIEQKWDQEIAATESQQEQEKGTRRVTLARIGGFLGQSASAVGNLKKLTQTHKSEIRTLEAKKQSAIQEAKMAFRDDSIELAKEKIKTAQETRDQIRQRKQDFFDNKMDILKEQRRQDESYRKKINNDLKKFEKLATSDQPIEVDRRRVQEINEFYGSDTFFSDYLNTVRRESQIKSFREKEDQDIKKLNLLSSVPSNTTVEIGGVSYRGLKQPDDDTETLSRNIANVVGLPETVVGASERDLILSLEMTNPPTWFRNWKEESARQSFSEKNIEQQWETFRNSPDIRSYRNTMQLNERNRDIFTFMGSTPSTTGGATTESNADTGGSSDPVDDTINEVQGN